MAVFGTFNKERIPLPYNLKTDVRGFSFFARLLDVTAARKHFVLDFSEVDWFDANLCALLSVIILTNREAGARFSVENIRKPQLRNTLQNIGLFAMLKNEEHLGGQNSAIPIRKFDMKNEELVEEYIYRYILKSSMVPKMSSGAQRKVYRSIFEIYQNSVMHSDADFNMVCGQYFNYRGTMALTMVEVGRTFRDNVCGHNPEYREFSGKQAIEWAVEAGNTTKQASETGGLGLDLIREFLKLNKGKLQILSSDGYWEEKKGVILAKDCDSSFQGSVVNIEFNLRDTNQYSTPEELDIRNIL